MEELSLYLQDYKGLIGNLASFVTIGQFLAGGFICKDIYKQGSTNGISSVPFVGGISVGLLMLKYAFILNDEATLTVNVAAIGLNVCYLLFYLIYSREKLDVFKSLAIGGALVAVVLGYASVEDESLIEQRFGIIITVLILILIGAPLFGFREVIEKKDASSIPFPLVFSGTIVSFLWLLYGVILLNYFMVFQNVVGLILCIIQLALCLMYPPKSKTE